MIKSCFCLKIDFTRFYDFFLKFSRWKWKLSFKIPLDWLVNKKCRNQKDGISRCEWGDTETMGRLSSCDPPTAGNWKWKKESEVRFGTLLREGRLVGQKGFISYVKLMRTWPTFDMFGPFLSVQLILI